MSKLKRLEVVKFGPFRFIGKSVYASNARGKDELCDYMLKQNWVFEELDKLHEYTTDETHNIGLLHWEAYGYHEDNPKVDNLFYGPTELFGYTVGRFFKPDTPVPEDMNYIDISEMYVAKAWLKANPGDTHGDIDFGLVKDTVNKTTEYNHNFSLFTAEIYCVHDEDGELVNGYYIACQPK